MSPLILRRYRRDNCEVTIEVRQWLPWLVLLLALVGYGFSLATSPADPAENTQAAALPTIMVVITTMVGGYMLAAFLWARALAVHISAQRHLRYTAVQVGDELEEQILLTNSTWIPALWIEFIDQSTLPGYTLASVRAADAAATLKWEAGTICKRCGIFNLGPWRLHLGDPFGVFLVRQVYQHIEEILVYPPIAALPHHLLPQAALAGDQRPRRQPLPAQTIPAFTTRPYVSGDPLRHMHWRTTARRDEPFVKVFQPEASSSIWLIPDFDQAAHVSQGDDSTHDLLMLLTASLAYHLLYTHQSVGLLARAAELKVVLPQYTPAHFWEIITALAPLGPTPGRPLAQTLAEARQIIPARSLILVITPSLNRDWPAELAHLSTFGRRAEIFMIDPASFGGPAPAEQLLPLLTELGLQPKIIHRGEVVPLRRSAARRWKFRTLGTGRVVVQDAPHGAQPLQTPAVVQTAEAEPEQPR